MISARVPMQVLHQRGSGSGSGSGRGSGSENKTQTYFFVSAPWSTARTNLSCGVNALSENSSEHGGWSKPRAVFPNPPSQSQGHSSLVCTPKGKLLDLFMVSDSGGAPSDDGIGIVGVVMPAR
jgi:hypothetical protein